MRKKILIGIIIMIAILIPVVVFALKENSLYLPPAGPEKITKNYSEISSNSITTSKTSELTENESKMIQQMQQESEEYQKKNEEAREILRKYNPNTFDELYETNIENYEKQGFHDSELTNEEKQLYKMIIDTYENDNLNENERNILKQQIEENYDYIRSIPGLQERADKILNK